MKKLFKFGLIALVMVIGFLVGVALLIDYTGRKRLAEEIARIEALGGVLDFSSYAQPDLPDAENAALLWLEAAELLERADEASPVVMVEPEETSDEEYGEFGGYDGEYETWPEVEAIDDPQHAEIEVLRAAIAARRSALDAAWAAAEMQRSCWPVDYDNPDFFMGLNYLAPGRSVARLLVADAWLAFREGDDTRAEARLLAALALADDMQHPPLAITTWVSIWIDWMVVDALQAIPAGPARYPAAVLEVLASRDYRARRARGVLGETPAVIGAEINEEMLEWMDVSPWEYRFMGFWQKHDRAFILRGYCESYPLLLRPYHEVEAKLRDLESREVPYVYPLAEIWGPSFSDSARTTAALEASRDLLLWANRLGVSPTTADTPMDDTRFKNPPTDGLTGGPMKAWAAPDGGYVLWSPHAEAAEDYLLRYELVWRVGTQELPPELVPFADQLIDTNDAGY